VCPLEPRAGNVHLSRRRLLARGRARRGIPLARARNIPRPHAGSDGLTAELRLAQVERHPRAGARRLGNRHGLALRADDPARAAKGSTSAAVPTRSRAPRRRRASSSPASPRAPIPADSGAVPSGARPARGPSAAVRRCSGARPPGFRARRASDVPPDRPATAAPSRGLDLLSLLRPSHLYSSPPGSLLRAERRERPYRTSAIPARSLSKNRQQTGAVFLSTRTTPLACGRALRASSTSSEQRARCLSKRRGGGVRAQAISRASAPGRARPDEQSAHSLGSIAPAGPLHAVSRVRRGPSEAGVTQPGFGRATRPSAPAGLEQHTSSATSSSEQASGLADHAASDDRCAHFCGWSRVDAQCVNNDLNAAGSAILIRD